MTASHRTWTFCLEQQYQVWFVSEIYNTHKHERCFKSNKILHTRSEIKTMFFDKLVNLFCVINFLQCQTFLAKLIISYDYTSPDQNEYIKTVFMEFAMV